MLITFEGGEGAGKTTQITRLTQALSRAGLNPLLTREPGGTPTGTRIREVLLDPALSVDPVTELLLYNAARRQLVQDVIRPALEMGQVVIIDRFTDSTRAYQGAGRGLDPALIEQTNHAATGGLEADLTFLLDLDPREGLRRAGARGGLDRLEQADLGFHERLRQGFLDLAAREARFQVINASMPPEQVWADVLHHLRRRTALPLDPQGTP